MQSWNPLANLAQSSKFSPDGRTEIDDIRLWQEHTGSTCSVYISPTRHLLKVHLQRTWGGLPQFKHATGEEGLFTCALFAFLEVCKLVWLTL